MDLFEPHTQSADSAGHAPLAERVRPASLEEFAGQDHLLGEGKPLRVLIMSDQIPSIILWGPPGSGKTTLARLIARHTASAFFSLNAVSSGVKEVREVLEKAAIARNRAGKKTILFIDEIHRFNKAQQDALLHSVEHGVITLIGATTENPSFEVIPPLLSRARVYVLEPLDAGQLNSIADHALRSDPTMAALNVSLDDRDALLALSGGDARVLLNGLETAVLLARDNPGGERHVGRKEIEEAFQRRQARYDHDGEQHYNIISAFIKSLRGSDPDAAVYWLARMLDGGEDPKFIARRMVILASEDVGNADPYALTLAMSVFNAVHVLGMPEARIILSQGATYLASAPKSNASYRAIDAALADVRGMSEPPVPLHLRNAPTALMKNLNYGTEYRYPHDFPGNFVDQQYLPDILTTKIYYEPSGNGGEKRIGERLIEWWKRRRAR